VEVHSAWGEFEWMITQSLKQGHQVGVVANSDGHKGRPGTSYPGESHFGAYGGLTALYASELTRDGIFGALQDRRCYGTSGQRIIVRFSSSDLFMGQVGTIEGMGGPAFDVRVCGTAPLERLDLLRNAEVVATWDAFEGLKPSNRIRVEWSGARILGRDRATHWDGGLSVSGTTITDVAPWAFDCLFEGITLQTDTGVQWRSITTGDADGVILTLDDPHAGVLNFEAGPCDFELPLDELDGLEPYVQQAGGVEQKVVIRRLPATSPPLDVDLQMTPECAETKGYGYWLRVRQIDGAKAWTSPIYISD
jgi:hypothetical protein